MARVNPRQATRRLVRRAVILPGRESNQLQRRRPAGDIITQAAAFGGLNWRVQSAVKELFGFLMGKGQLLAADFQQLIAHAQVGDASCGRLRDSTTRVRFSG